MRKKASAKIAPAPPYTSNSTSTSSTLSVPPYLPPPTPYHHTKTDDDFFAPPSATPSIAQAADSHDENSPPQKLRQHQRATTSSSTLSLLVATWNLHGKEPPDDLRQWLLSGTGGEATHDLYAIGTQEAGRSIEMSLLMPSKARWEARLRDALGDDYECFGCQTLAAIHVALFARRSLLPLVSDVRTAHVATGFANTLGNKGGVAVSFQVGETSFLVVNSHLAAHQHAVKQRNSNYHRIEALLPLRPRGMTAPQVAAGSSGADGSDDDDVESPSRREHASSLFDITIWMGDLNYRVNGNRAAIDALLAPPGERQRAAPDWAGEEAHWERNLAVLLANDQLQRERAAGRAFAGFEEGDIAFRPTYKFDRVRVAAEEDAYDTSEKRRVPAYTDRVLWRAREPRDVELVRYGSVSEVRTSDHRPVVAELRVNYDAGSAPPPGRHGVASSPGYSRLSRGGRARAGVASRQQASLICACM